MRRLRLPHGFAPSRQRRPKTGFGGASYRECVGFPLLIASAYDRRATGLLVLLCARMGRLASHPPALAADLDAKGGIVGRSPRPGEAGRAAGGRPAVGQVDVLDAGLANERVEQAHGCGRNSAHLAHSFFLEGSSNSCVRWRPRPGWRFTGRPHSVRLFRRSVNQWRSPLMVTQMIFTGASCAEDTPRCP